MSSMTPILGRKRVTDTVVVVIFELAEQNNLRVFLANATDPAVPLRSGGAMPSYRGCDAQLLYTSLAINSHTVTCHGCILLD
uniref:Uncharacterized protein n=1 Tax=Oryza glumipatula TaxID=40148 RepID=A0A0D9Z9Y3_9ORYZ